MQYSFAFRLLVAAVAATAGFSAPGIALAHGLAHAQEADHVHLQQHVAGMHHEPVGSHEVASGQLDGHDHVLVQPTVVKRPGSEFVPGVPHAIIVRFALEHMVSLPIAESDILHPFLISDGPPPQLRAPPAS